MGTCCVSGCGEIVIDEEAKEFSLGGKTLHEGDFLSIDGSTGNIYYGAIPTSPAAISGDFGRFMGWADKVRKLKVLTNADTPRDAKQGREFGAQGIGLCRTEHMFFEESRIKAMREMIVAETTEDRKKALAKIEPYQQGDFEALYEAMEGDPVTIRFLDPPLHEFLPTKEEDIKEIADELGITVAKLKEVIASLHEFNPMMGHRGCRLAVSYPEIAEMQTTAVIQAAINVTKKGNFAVKPQIMIPLVGEVKELKFVKDVVVATADKLIAESGIDLEYEVGTMIEIPRAALTADEIATEAELFSFGTNDLTPVSYTHLWPGWPWGAPQPQRADPALFSGAPCVWKTDTDAGDRGAGKVQRRGEGDAPLVEGVGREEHLGPHLPQPAGHLGHPDGIAGEVAVGDDLPPGDAGGLGLPQEGDGVPRPEEGLAPKTHRRAQGEAPCQPGERPLAEGVGEVTGVGGRTSPPGSSGHSGRCSGRSW